MNDINTLFERKSLVDAKDPGDIIPSDIDTLVEFYRYRRANKMKMTQSRDITSLDEIMPKPKPKLLGLKIGRF
jgi:hypothetical protein